MGSHYRSRSWLAFRVAPTALSCLIVLTGLLAVFELAEANHLELKWDGPTRNDDGTPLQDLAGYRVYYGLTSKQSAAGPCNDQHVDVANLTDYYVDGLAAGQTYYVQVTAIDSSGHESACSNEVSALSSDAPSTATTAGVASTATTAGVASTAASGDSGGGGGGGGGCFIATAAFGSPLAREVVVLQELRDRYLLTNPPGRAFVAGYYRVSPPIADWLRRHESARTATREALRPLVWWAGLVLRSPMVGLAFSTMLLGVPLVVVCGRGRRLLSQAGPRRQP